jgi:hypothetical protein
MSLTKRKMDAFTFAELMQQIEVAQMLAEDGALATAAAMLRQVADELDARAAQKRRLLGGDPSPALRAPSPSRGEGAQEPQASVPEGGAT